MKRRKKAGYRTCTWCVNKDNLDQTSKTFDLARRSFEGDGVPVNEKQGLELLLKASGQGDCRAQCMIGQRYIIGDGIEQNIGEGMRLMHLSVAQGYVGAQMCLGKIYMNDKGSFYDPKKGEELLRLAASNGSPAASAWLSKLFSTGNNQDLQAARKMRKQARQQFAKPHLGAHNILVAEFSRQCCSNVGCVKTENPDPQAEKAVSSCQLFFIVSSFTFSNHRVGFTCVRVKKRSIAPR
jgi:TPR repeat protein